MATQASTIISDARAYAAGLQALTAQAMGAANQAISNVPVTVTSYSVPPLPQYTAPVAIAAPPSIPAVTLAIGAAPTNLALPTIPAINAGVAPTFSAVAPLLDSVDRPGALATFVGTAPTINTSITFPEPPSALVNPIITDLVLPTRAEPVRPQTTLPAFTAQLPIDTSVAPTGLDLTFSNAYASAAPSTATMVSGYVDSLVAKYNPQFSNQMAAIEVQLSKYLAGGTALNSAVEDAIYARARAKNDVDAKRVQDAAFQDAASRGFTLPSGALASSLAQARRDSYIANARAGNEIAIAQAEMEQKNLQFAITTSANLRTAMLNAAMTYMQSLVTLNGQSIEYAKNVVTALVETYNAQIKMYSARLDAYRASASVFDVQLRSALAGVELYRTEITALQALTQTDLAKVEVYRARMEVLKTLADVYQSQISTVQGRVGLEKLKLDLFQTQVQTYATQVQSKTAEWQGYSAAIEGQVAKTKVYAVQADAFSAQIQGYKASIEAQVANVQAASAAVDAVAKTNSAAQETYRTVMQANGEVARTQIASNQTLIQAYEATARANVANATTAAEYFKTVATVGIEQAKLVISTGIESGKVEQARAEAIASVSSQNANVLGSLVGAAMAGMNTLASESYVS